MIDTTGVEYHWTLRLMLQQLSASARHPLPGACWFWNIGIFLSVAFVDARAEIPTPTQSGPASDRSVHSAKPASVGSDFWAFQPVTNPSLPSVKKIAWVRSPIDVFILSALESKNLEPAEPADRRTWIRRVSFDLTGLPPAPAEIDAFLADTSADASTRAVERLIQSPQYGIRWGRHWLDVARYADSNGLDENVAFGNAWRYRDYVVHSFNQDKPYNQFLTEQLAGDLLPTAESITVRHERLTALGFLSLGPKLLAEPDKMKLEMDIIDEQIDTLGRTFLGMTMGCARCHDHKFDPIPTEDYYALAAILKSTHTMDDLATIAKWHEPVVANPEEQRTQELHERRISDQKLSISNFVAVANRQLLTASPSNALPAKPEKFYPTNQLADLEKLRATLKQLEENSPELPSTMGVTERTNLSLTLPVHVRGSHLSLGKPVSRGVPSAMTAVAKAPHFSPSQSGRLEFAQWLTNPSHPLTARVLVNRIWRWHFGRGLVSSTDNFGHLGERPSHPELLDWLAHRFMADGWSIKSLHRLIVLSSTYQMATNPRPESHRIDSENRWYSEFPSRRLEAEEIRDALLTIAGTLELSIGGKTIPIKNREFFFNHTSKDTTTYESQRRAIYMPVVRNHLYDWFEQFDYPDPAVPNGNRVATVVAPQALLLMNSDLVYQAAARFAATLLADHPTADDQRLIAAYLKALGRPPTEIERLRSAQFLKEFPSGSNQFDPKTHRLEAWTTLCHSLLAANEFIYLN